MIELQSQPVEIGHSSLLRSVPTNKTKTVPLMDMKSMKDELIHLQQACDLHVSSLNRARDSIVEMALNVAELITHSGLQNAILPRNYQVKVFQSELYLVKLNSEGAPLFVATGQDNMFTRMHLNNQSGLRPCDLAEFAEDLNQGLLGELTAYVACRLRAFNLVQEPGTSEPDIAPAAIPESPRAQVKNAPRQLQLSSLGRSSRRMAVA